MFLIIHPQANVIEKKKAERGGEGEGLDIGNITRACCSIIGEVLTEVEECSVCYKGHEAAWRDWYLVDSNDWISFSLASYLGCEACVYPSSCVVKPICHSVGCKAREVQ